MNGGVGRYRIFFIQFCTFIRDNSQEISFMCVIKTLHLDTTACIYTVDIPAMTSIQPREARTNASRSSRDMVEFLTSEPPFTDQDTETGTRLSQERRPFYGKTERRSGGCVQRWNNFWGPSRPDLWLSRKFAVG
jgi:hypothetical protein